MSSIMPENMLFPLAAAGSAIAGLLMLLRPAQCAVTGRKPDPGTDWTSRPDLHARTRESAPATGKRYLIIGTGSVGLTIMDALLQRGEKQVKGFDVAKPKRELKVPGAEFVIGSISDYNALRDACKDVDVVFLTAALIRYYERLAWQYSDSHAVNVTGTANVVRACIECGVQILVQTSSSNVCIAPGLARENMDEQSPLVDASNSPNHYGWTKVQAENAILAANGARLPNNNGKLVTGSIRPCSGIFGPGDNFMTERFLREGKVQIIIPDPKIDYVYVENVVWGHLLLEKKLLSDADAVGGQVFCVSNEEPIVADDFYAALAFFYQQVTGKPLLRTYLPIGLLTLIAWLNESFQRIFRKRVTGDLANLTPAMFKLAALSYTFSSKKAKTLLGYEPIYTLDEALQKTVFLATNNGKL
eukprot:TRINITY_DN58456_c0_g1_i1.p1 TRINITY_DN58456_c0_g1~~TRINITY_DN58456_c0_g1_i1.p1  ORF type:complete len:416 (-),score=70.90 TRINITY_DN58456_c0_g1_i1:110-1357(-)